MVSIDRAYGGHMAVDFENKNNNPRFFLVKIRDSKWPTIIAYQSSFPLGVANVVTDWHVISTFRSLIFPLAY